MKPSLASCQTRCTGEKTPFMTYKKDGNCRCDKTCNNYRKYSNCSSGGDVYKAGAGPAPTPKPTDPPAAGGWALVKACHFCPENNGSWGKQPSLDACKKRCLGENTPFMTFKKDKNCRCDRTCNNYRKYSNCNSGGDVYKKGAGPAPAPAGGWALVKACHFCSENNGSWGKKPSLASCQTRCTGEKTPFMTYKKDGNCRCDKTCNNYRKYGNCSSGGDVYKAGPAPATGGYNVVKACHFCSENNGSWGKQPSLDACKKRCLGENTPFMTFKKDKNCRCDRTCNNYKKYSNCNSGGDVYKKGAAPAPTPRPTKPPTPQPTKPPTPQPTKPPTPAPTDAPAGGGWALVKACHHCSENNG